MNNKKLLKYHSISGLIAGIFLFILGITGSILVFNSNIDNAIAQKYETQGFPEAFQLDSAIKNVQDQYKNWSTRIIHFKKGETFVFNVRKPNERKLVFVAPHTGKIIGEINEGSHLSKWMLKLHYSLHAGVIGKFIILIVGVLFFISLISGIILFRKNILKTLLFKVKLKKKNKRTYYSVLHRYIGVWALFLNLVLVFTGIFLSYNVAVGGLKKKSITSPPIVKTSVEKILNNLKKNHPDFNPEYIRLPSTKGKKIVINGPFKNDPFYYSIHYNKVEINYKTGKISKIKKTAHESFLYRFNSSILPFHYGQFAGIFGKIIYSVIGLSGPFLSITGFYLWYKRKKKKKKKAK
ncbi:PepSY-associated TM helix domain-containing protein [Mesonia aestuariivivens]|uniref:PepSY domain-containing protein n=1 Tax=Mesonia aestuariivivens TaxID=2796128 RepID=A0ABS6VY79_9FLAO|nr:PepSY-associated TM helix domain-containing protein [Mesonia aestuariivivens]MBW2960236.1 PepSY domain-containing protein [Mesonia aestuariivivens]